VTDSEKRAHFTDIMKILLLVYWVRQGFKL